MNNSIFILLFLTTTLPVFGAATGIAKAPLSPRTTRALQVLLYQLLPEQLSLPPAPDLLSSEGVTPEKSREAHDIVARMLGHMRSSTEAPAAAIERKDEAKESATQLNHAVLKEIIESPECQYVLLSVASSIEYGFHYPLDDFAFSNPLLLMVHGLRATGENQETINQLWQHGRSFFTKRIISTKEVLKNELSPAWRAHVAPLLKLYEILYAMAPKTTIVKVKSPEEVNKLLC